MRDLTRRDFCGTAVALALAASRLRAAPVDGDAGGVLLYSGWATKNIGDIGHTPGTLRYLEEFCPDTPVTLWLANGNDRVIDMLRRRFPRVSIVQGKLDGTGKADDPDLQAAFDRCRVLLYNSGMIFNDRWPPPDHVVKACLAHDKEFGLYGQSFDGFAPEDQERLVGLLSHAAFIYTRDVESYYYLRRSGVTSSILEFGPDGCFGIDVRDDTTADRYLDTHGLKPKEFITVTIRSDTWVDGVRANHPRVVERWAAGLREIINAWVSTTGGKVLLAPEVEKEIEAARTLLFERLSPNVRPNVVLRDTFWNVDEAASVYERAHTVVAMEPHSCIVALAGGTPAIHYFSAGHGRKAWMFRDIGLPEWLISADDETAGDVVAALMAIRQDYARAQGKVERTMAFVDRRSSEMMATLRRVLETQS